jgi:hypothetical protein
MDGMQKVLEEIRDLLQPKENFSIVLSSDTTDWTTFFNPPLYLDPKRKYEFALVNLETYNSIPNVTATNNTFVYSPDSGTTWKTITLPEGSYELAQITAEIQRQLETNGDWNAGAQSHYITVGANKSTLRAFLEITSPAYQVDMASSSIRTTLGHIPQTLISGYHEGENPVDILSVNSILVNCDFINGSFLNGSQLPVVYSFFPNVSPGYKIVESPNNLVYLPISQAGNIQRVRVWLTDQDGKQLNLRGETITIRFHVRGL